MDYKELNKCRTYIEDSLRRLGYKPDTDGNNWANSKEALKLRSAQYRLRDSTEKPRDMYEVEIAICEAITLQGGYIVYPGDGVGCAAQMVWAQHERAERAEKELERLKNEQKPNC